MKISFHSGRAQIMAAPQFFSPFFHLFLFFIHFFKLLTRYKLASLRAWSEPPCFTNKVLEYPGDKWIIVLAPSCERILCELNRESLRIFLCQSGISFFQETESWKFVTQKPRKMLVFKEQVSHSVKGTEKQQLRCNYRNINSCVFS